MTQQSGNKGSIAQHNKGHIWETCSQHYTHWEKNKNFPTKIRNKTSFSTLTTYIQHSIGSPSHSNQTRKRNKRHTNWKGGNELSLFVDDMIVYMENHIESTKKNTQPNKWIWQNSWIQSQHSEIKGIPVPTMKCQKQKSGKKIPFDIATWKIK